MKSMHIFRIDIRALSGFLFGWIFPDFAGLAAFNRVDTVLHSIVGITGLTIGMYEAKKS